MLYLYWCLMHLCKLARLHWQLTSLCSSNWLVGWVGYVFFIVSARKIHGIILTRQCSNALALKCTTLLDWFSQLVARRSMSQEGNYSFLIQEDLSSFLLLKKGKHFYLTTSLYAMDSFSNGVDVTIISQTYSYLPIFFKKKVLEQVFYQEEGERQIIYIAPHLN